MIKKTVYRTRDEKVAAAKTRLNSAQIMFTQAKEEVEASDRELDVIVEETKAQMAELQATLNEIAASKEQNGKFKAKLNEFIDIK